MCVFFMSLSIPLCTPVTYYLQTWEIIVWYFEFVDVVGVGLPLPVLGDGGMQKPEESVSVCHKLINVFDEVIKKTKVITSRFVKFSK